MAPFSRTPHGPSQTKIIHHKDTEGTERNSVSGPLCALCVSVVEFLLGMRAA
jgi:hypothetical protein